MRQSFTGISVTTRTPDLLQIVQDNRAKHQATYETALIEYRRQAIKKLEELLAGFSASADASRWPSLYIELRQPEQHLEDYDRAIKMLGMHTDPTIDLNEQMFTNLVDDEWAWSRGFADNTIAYASAYNGAA